MRYEVKLYKLMQETGGIRVFKRRKMIDVAWALLEGLALIAAILGAIYAVMVLWR